MILFVLFFCIIIASQSVEQWCDMLQENFGRGCIQSFVHSFGARFCSKTCKDVCMKLVSITDEISDCDYVIFEDEIARYQKLFE